MKNDIYLNILKFTLKRGHNGLSYKEFKDEFGDNKEAIFLSAINNSSFVLKSANRKESDKLESYFLLSFEGNMRLFDYLERKTARKSILNATRFAMAALLVSILSTTVSIYYSNQLINTPSQLIQSQVTTLDGSATRHVVEHINDKQNIIHSELKIISSELKIIGGALEKLYKHNQTYPRGSN
ncbi:MAG: hypothetical protein ACC707_03715 [Thiohalomonadales bacterium]